MDVRHFFALSRTPHALLDLAAPAVTALLWAGRMAEIRIIVLGLVTSFAAYTAVYALNDLVDCRRDARRAAGCLDPHVDLDAAMQLHPVAQGCLSFRAGLSWTLFWGVVASVGSYLLNPVCLIMFLGACLFEAGYCALGGVTPLRALLAGVVKSAGPLAAIFAVDPAPSTGRFILFLAWLFLWEIGGQNIPNDLADVAEDSRLGFRTVPVSIGPGSVAAITFGALVVTVLLSLSLSPVAGTSGGILIALLTASIGVGLLLFPAYRLFASADRRNALYLFNRASYYPLSLLVLTTARITLRL